MLRSRHNDVLKTARALLRRSGRQRHGLFCVEGHRALRTVLDAGAHVAIILVEETSDLAPLGPVPDGVRVETVAVGLLEGITDTVTPAGVVGLVEAPRTNLADVLAADRVVVLDGVRDPGNVGTILRCADAVGATVLLAPGCCDPLSPKVVRATAGAVVRVRWTGLAEERLSAWLAERRDQVVVLDSSGDGGLHDRALPYPLVLLAGGEADGPSAERPGRRCRLPMRPGCESLNVAMATSIALYESLRQRPWAQHGGTE